jgi:hypothetical protein
MTEQDLNIVEPVTDGDEATDGQLIEGSIVYEGTISNCRRVH